MKNNLVLILISSILSLVLAEGVLRLYGFVPGQFQFNQWIEIVDELKMKDGFIGDENGILKVDTAVSNNIQNILNAKSINRKSYDDFDFRDNLSGEFDALMRNYFDKGWLEKENNEFTRRVESIVNNKNWSCTDSLIIQTLREPINRDGFFSIPFSVKTNGKPKVLLLGDSFTWGHSTSHKTASFSNTLLARDFVVFNTGISGADVAQYKRIAEIYIERLQPDIVVLNFFMGNDVSYIERPIIPGVPLMYHTNAGNINSFQDNTQHTNMQDAYADVLIHLTIPQTTTINRLLSKTVISTLVWKQLEKMGFVKQASFSSIKRPEVPSCNAEIASIKEFCDSFNIPFVLSVIPEIKNNSVFNASTVDFLFEGLEYSEPEMTTKMFNTNDGHFNDEGHQFYADYLEKLMEQTLINRKTRSY